ncbi:MAG TPA: LemA family protein [Balneola sp.]|jgi:LemA protein|nr:LemA family protein [Bacteroidota bacterium]MAC04861.1 LemA family protein [Balneola sp.]MAO78777.1 LemA family protein [Balneola sp.]MBF64707.1 LemA family protein [Balneola sp.]HAH51772.1 LemA family protein [Balneola sp.]|tara:strand:+ start:16917 stop:17507 length:591 start_codon:yes stop_codon:yes gene_type:complete
MKGKLIIGLVVVGLLVFFGISINNGLVEKEEAVEGAWAQVENQYQRRADLIPNLVNTVKGAANFEQETLTSVIEARSKATSVNINASDLSDPAKFQQFQQAQGELSGALSRLLVSVERYPELKANSNFRDLQSQLEGTENRIATERKRFNDTAQSYNSSIRKFPTSIFASIGGFERKAYFEADQGAENAPTVDFGN